MISEKDFTSIVADTKKYVLGAIAKKLPDEYAHSIDDIVQETYIRAFRSLENNKFREESKLSTWLYRIAVNETLRMIDKLNREEKKKRKLKKHQQKQFEKEIFENREIDKKTKLLETIELLPDYQAGIVRLYLEGYKIKEIADKYNLPTGTVKSRISRAKLVLNKIIKGEENE